jgi:hypothetical protein
METGAIERRAALIDEDVCRPRLLLLLQPAQRPQFSTVERMSRRRAILFAANVQCGAPEIEVFPAQSKQPKTCLSGPLFGTTNAMNKLMLRILRELYPDEFPKREPTPEQRQRGRDLAKYKPWARGRIGGLERRIHGAVVSAEIKKVLPFTTGFVVREVYMGVGGRSKEPRIKRWMYDNIKRALPTYAVRIGRGNGHGSPVLWMPKPGDARYSSVVRKLKEKEYARRKGQSTPPRAGQ